MDALQKSLDEIHSQGTQVITVLSHQQQQLEAAESTCEQVRFKQAKAARMLRGMSWYGWFLNLFTREPEEPPQRQVKPEYCPTPHSEKLDAQVDEILAISKIIQEQLRTTTALTSMKV